MKATNLSLFCHECGSRLEMLLEDEKIIVWKCLECGKIVNEYKNNPE